MVDYFFGKYGLHKGTVISLIVMSPFLLLIMWIIHNSQELFYIILGMYGLLFFIHAHNYRDLKELKEEVTEKRRTAKEKRKRNKGYPYKKVRKSG
jgi:hypothetical protein